MPPLRPEILSWTALLARWTESAGAAMAIPDEDDGDRWRASVAAVIQLQAITFALADLEHLEPADRPFACDRAEILVRESAQAIDSAWSGAALADSIVEIIDDAVHALALAPWFGARELLWPGPGPLLVPELPVDGDHGSLAVMQPGTFAMPGSPVAWWIDRDGEALVRLLPGCRLGSPPIPRQVYRILDESGEIVEDVLAAVNEEPVAGLPLLVPICHRGERIGSFTLDAERWRAQQEFSLAGGTVPVREA